MEQYGFAVEEASKAVLKLKAPNSETQLTWIEALRQCCKTYTPFAEMSLVRERTMQRTRQLISSLGQVAQSLNEETAEFSRQLNLSPHVLGNAPIARPVPQPERILEKDKIKAASGLANLAKENQGIQRIIPAKKHQMSERPPKKSNPKKRARHFLDESESNLEDEFVYAVRPRVRKMDTSGDIQTVYFKRGEAREIVEVEYASTLKPTAEQLWEELQLAKRIKQGGRMEEVHDCSEVGFKFRLIGSDRTLLFGAGFSFHWIPK